MKIRENEILVDRDEYARLCRLDGRVDAVQNYVDKQEYVSIDEMLDILMVDKTKMLKRHAENTRKYEQELQEGVCNECI